VGAKHGVNKEDCGDLKTKERISKKKMESSRILKLK
jgi:hypothetical protein